MLLNIVFSTSKCSSRRDDSFYGYQSPSRKKKPPPTSEPPYLQRGLTLTPKLTSADFSYASNPTKIGIQTFAKQKLVQ